MGAFVVIGSLIVYARASTVDYRAEFIANDTLALSYVDEKPSVVEKRPDKSTVYISRARTIDVSKTGTLFCTPENQGTVTEKQLSAVEQNQVNEQIKKAKNESLPADSEKASDQVYVNDYRGLFIRDLGVSENSRIYSPDLESAYFKDTVKLLEDLCASSTAPAPGSTAPQWDILNTNKKSSFNQSKPNPIAQAIMPKAEASAATPAGAAYGPDTRHEDVQSALYLAARKNAGVPATIRVKCLDVAAREWAKTMAADDILRHSNPLARLPELFCGQTWEKIGENVGVQGIAVGNDDNASAQAAYIIVQAYWNSPGHKANMLDPAYQYHGIGSWKTADGTKIYTAHSFWRGPIKK